MKHFLVSRTADPHDTYYFPVSVDGPGSARTNVWAHGVEARTYFPNKDVPGNNCS